jgi:hypothetical protein
MLIQEILSGPRARAVIRHEQAYDFDDKTGLWHRRLVDEQEASNIVTNAGRVRIHTYLYGAGGQRTPLGTGLNYIALTNDATAPAQTDTVLAGEITNTPATAGLQRALATVTLPTGSGTQSVLQKIFTYTGVPGPQTVQKTALFDDATVGTMAHEIQFSPRTLFTNDTLTVTFSITLS